MTTTRPMGAGVHVPPPLYFALPFVAGYLIHRHAMSGDRFPLPPTVRAAIGAALIAFGAGLAAFAVAYFVRLRVSIIPFRPASQLVCAGPYRISRNPMYTGQVFVYLGLALVLNIAWPLALLPVGLFLIDRLVIAPEEQYLRSAFPDEYVAYSARARRWL